MKKLLLFGLITLVAAGCNFQTQISSQTKDNTQANTLDRNSTQPTTATPEQIYKNEDFGFEITVPRNWVSSNEPGSVLYDDGTMKYLNEPEIFSGECGDNLAQLGAYKSQIVYSNPSNSDTITVRTDDLSKNHIIYFDPGLGDDNQPISFNVSNFEKFINGDNSVQNSISTGVDLLSTERETISNHNVLIQKGSISGGGPCGDITESAKESVEFFTAPGKYVDIEINLSGNQDTLLNQIVSSLKIY